MDVRNTGRRGTRIIQGRYYVINSYFHVLIFILRSYYPWFSLSLSRALYLPLSLSFSLPLSLSVPLFFEIRSCVLSNVVEMYLKAMVLKQVPPFYVTFLSVVYYSWCFRVSFMGMRAI